ncbi:MAG: acyltransferase, partial [Lachnospiraceae bacterium]|nr:acyltransferase [Lachnospiraceae bacterium]
FTIGRLGVPIFLMISGYLLLDRVYDEERTLRFWKKNWVNLLRCTVFWYLIYDLFLKFYLKQEISILAVITDLLFVHKLNMGHAWYMPMILGMYVLVPFVSMALTSIDKHMLKFPMIFFTFIAFGCPLINVISHTLQIGGLSVQLSAGFSGGVYGLYMIMGYLLKKGFLKSFKTGTCVFIGSIGLVLGVALQIWAYSNNYEYNIWYDCLFLLIAGLMFFEAASRIRSVPMYTMVKQISYYSFAIYLIHGMIRIILIKCVANLHMMILVEVFVVWMLSFVISLLCAWFINKIPVVGRIILNTKK